MPASGPSFSSEFDQEQNDGSGRVYIYRPSQFFQGGTYPVVYVNGEKRFPLRNGGFNFVDGYVPTKCC